MAANRLKARELERAAAAARRRVSLLPLAPASTPPGEALAMLRRRGFEPSPSPPDIPFPADLAGEAAEALARALAHYAFRLFLRGAIQRGAGFRPEEATRYLTPAQAGSMAKQLVQLGLAQPLGRSRFRLTSPARSFGGTLEWYVARELEARLGFDVAHGLRFRARGVGGDLDVLAAAEGRLVYLGRHDLMSNVARAIAEGLRALSPPPP